MMDHGPDHSSRSTSTQPSRRVNIGGRLRAWFSRERFASLANRLGWSRLRQTPGLGWFVAIAVIALLIQGVGLANLIAIDGEKQDLQTERQTWQATASQRQTLLDEIESLRQEKFAAKQELHTTKGLIDAESARLAEVKAALKLTQELRDQAQREQAAAQSDALRQRELNDALASKITDLNTRKETAEAAVAQLEGDQARLAAAVAASKKLLEEHWAEVVRAQAHAQDLDAQAAASVEGIRKAREGLVKAQADLDEATRQHAKAAAERDATQVALAALKEESDKLTTDLGTLRSQFAQQQAAIADAKKASGEAVAARTAAEADLATLVAKLDRVNKQLAEKQGALAAEETLLQSAQTRHDALKSRVASLQAELKPLEEQRLVIDAEINGKKKEVEVLQQQLQSLRADLKNLLETVPKSIAPQVPTKQDPSVAPSSDAGTDDATPSAATKAE